jgi:CheY-like chemotaxis protein
MTLMLVEDNVPFRQVVKKLFEKTFSEILETSDGEAECIFTH